VHNNLSIQQVSQKKRQFALDERVNTKMHYPSSPPTPARWFEAACLCLCLVRSRSPERCSRRWPRPCSWSDDSTPRHSYPRTPHRRSRAAPRRCRRDASSGNSPEAASAAAGSRRDRMTPDSTVGTASCRRGTREPGFLVVQEGGCVAVFRLRRPRRMRDNDEVDVEVGACAYKCNLS
jgi:hypothetical protein